MRLAPTMMDLTSVLARMDFPVTGKLAKVGKVFFPRSFLMQGHLDLDSLCDEMRTHSTSFNALKSSFIIF